MRILLVSPLPPPEGGIAIWTKQYLSYCEENKIDVSVVDIALIGKRCKRINDKRSIFDEIKRTVNIVSDLRHKLKDFKPKYVHINSSCAKWGIFRDKLCVSVAKKFGVKVILHFRCTVPDRLGHDKIRYKAFIKMSQKADLLITLNRISESFVKKNVLFAKVKTIPNFIKLDRSFPKHTISPEIKNVLYAGHVQFDKGAGEIFEAAKAFPDKEFILAGPVSDEINISNAPSNVKLLGRVEHSTVHTLMESADLFLFPSYTEGFSNALVEAMSHGLPIIASDVGANRDMIEAGGGRIISPRSFEDIVRALRDLEDQATRESASRWNQNKVFNEYRIEIVMKQLFEAYKSI